MVLRAILFVIMTVGVIGFGAIAWVSMHPAVPVRVAVAPVEHAKVSLLVAAHTVNAGNLLKPEDMTSKDVDVGTEPTGAPTDTPDMRSSLVGAMVRRTLASGEPLMAKDVLRPGDHGFLAAVLAPGMRAVTVSVDAVSGTAGLIWPGDRVDLILLQSRDDKTLPAGQRVGAETVLANVRVIAIDQHLVRGVAPEGGPSPRSGDDRTATLEVTPEQAEKVSVAAHIGKLSLTVRAADPSGDKSNSDRPVANNNGGSAVTWASDVSPMLNPGKKSDETTIVRVYQGSDKNGKGEEFKF